MQTLQFLGNGSGFSESHTNAFFVKDNNLIIIDLSMTNRYKLLALQPEKYDNIFLFVTHMHDDHTSGIGLFLQHMYYQKQKKVYIVAPFEVRSDLKIEFELKGIDANAYEFKSPNKIKTLGINALAIKTKHAPELNGRCFGYIFYLDDRKIIYSGDTVEYDKFADYARDEKDEIYLDMSCDYGKVHILYDDVKEKATNLAEKTNVFFMHVDNLGKMEQLVKETKINVVKTI